jgi:hypothetical protein
MDMTNGGNLFFWSIPIHISKTTQPRSERLRAYGAAVKTLKTSFFVENRTLNIVEFRSEMSDGGRPFF